MKSRTPTSAPTPAASGLVLKPPTLLTLWLLDEIASPVLGPQGSDVETSAEMRDMALAFAVFAEPQKAAALLDGNTTDANAAAVLMPLAREIAGSIPTAELANLGKTIRDMMAAQQF